ncbi:glycosyltransferase [Leifsonia shinshuensis]
MTAPGGGTGRREMGQRVKSLAQDWARDAAELAAGTDVIAAGIGGLPIAGPVAEKVGAPLLRAHLQPLDAPSSAYPGPLFPKFDGNGLTRRLSHRLTAAGANMMVQAPGDAARTALGLDGRPPAPLPEIIYGFSPAVVPVASDRRTRRVATGYWTLPSDAAPPEELEAFLRSPDPVISVGFGSMHGQDPAALRDLVVTAVRQVGVRAVLLSGWGAIGTDHDRSPDVLTIDAVPHSWLFSRVAATVHHGGAGTTGAALTAGVPTIVVPFTADQPFWAQRANRLGVAPPPIPRAELTSDALARAIDVALDDPGMRSRARALGNTLRSETGTTTAVEHIEAALERH